MSDSATLLTHVLRHGDRALVLAQRLGEWIAHAPELEEDLALANISLDLLGQARHLYTYAGELEGEGHDEDHFAYWRDAADFRNPLMVEQPNDDFAVSIVRQWLHDIAALEHWTAMTKSSDETLAALAARARNETSFHVRHTESWVVRLADGTDESRARTERAIEMLWPFTAELHGPGDEGELRSSGVVVGEIGPGWKRRVSGVLEGVGLRMPLDVGQRDGGWHGRHSEHLEPLLAELQGLARLHPGATW